MARPARALLIAAFAAACARAPEPRVPDSPAPAAADPCIVAGTPAATADTLDVVLDPPPEQPALPQTGSDWFVAAHAFETLVRLDCTGTPRPGLAKSWERQHGGRTWTFTLREGAALPDGSPLLPDTVVAAWSQPRAAARLALAEVTSITVAGERSIRLSLAQPADSAPAILADPVLAPGLDRPPLWRDRAGRFLRLVPPSGDLRDAVDAGADLIVTADPATLAYASGRPDLVSIPLPWSRTYVLVAPRPFEPARDGRWRASLSRDVVREEARPAEPLVWWDVACSPAPKAASAARADDARIVFPAGDRVAAAIAGRLVAQGAAGPRGAVLPVPLPELLARLDGGQRLSAVLPLSRLDPTPCAIRSLALAGWSVAPLVDTRAQLIARRDGPPLQADGFGAIRVVPGGAPAP